MKRITPPVRKTDFTVFRGEFRTCRRGLLVASVLTGIAALVELIMLYLIAKLGSVALSGGSKAFDLPFTHAFSRNELALVLIGTVAFRGAIQFAVAQVQQSTLYQYEVRTRDDLLSHFLDAEWSTQASMETSEVYTALFTFLNQARSALQSLMQVSSSAVSFGFMVLGSFAIGGLWTFAIIGGTIVLAWSLRPFLKASRLAATDARLANRRFTKTMTETITLSRESRLYAVTENVKDRNRGMSELLADANRRAGLASTRQSVLYTTAVYLVAALGIGAVIHANLANPTPYISVILLLYRGLGYGQSLQSSYQTLIASEPAMDWLMKTRVELADHALPDVGVPFEPPLASMAFSHVSFAYGAGDPAVDDLTFTLTRGDALGVVGPSGAGKSTLVQLLLRLRLPTHGQIMVNGEDITTINPTTWFGHVVLVPQEAGLANMSVLENVLWFRDGLTREDAIEALRSAHVLDEVLAFPDGLDMQVGERGGRLSGGQRQRVCIARALAGRPDVLILDEPTSALDLVSEEAIRKALDALRGHITLVIVAHRLSTLRICDQVMVLRAGKIEALSQREELEAGNEFYSEALRLSRLV